MSAPRPTVLVVLTCLALVAMALNVMCGIGNGTKGVCALTGDRAVAVLLAACCVATLLTFVPAA